MDASTSQPNMPLRRRTVAPRKVPVVSEDKSVSTNRPRSTRLTQVGTTRHRSPAKPEIDRPRSPRDMTPLELNGQILHPDEITPIVGLTSPDDPPLNVTPVSPQSFPDSEVKIDELDQQADPSSPIYVESSFPSLTPQPPIPGLPSTFEQKETEVSRRSPVLPRHEPSSISPKKRPVQDEPSSTIKKTGSRKGKRPPPKKLHVPDFARMSHIDRVASLVTYRKRFSNLRDAFPGLGIEKIPEDYEATPDNLLRLHKMYDGYMTHVLVSEDVSQSMIILIIVLGCVELFVTKVLGLPASNYVIKQFKLIGKYRSLLYELGEERIASSGGVSPPLVRLMYLILLTSITTVGIRLFESTIGKSGASMAEDVIYGILGGGGADAPVGDPTQNVGGFDLNGLLKFAGNFLGGNSGATIPKQETRGPTFDE